MKILVTGGAGYIGSFMIKRLLEEGHEVTCVDSLERGDSSRIDPKATYIQGDLGDKNILQQVFATHFDGVIHFAGYISMGESMENPGLYFEKNTVVTLNLLEAMKTAGVRNIIFSSTAGIYGNPAQVPIPETHLANPTNPYGESKRLIEQMLVWYQKIYGISFASLRYFNAAGAALDGSLGENHKPETHIIPNILKAILTDSEFTLFGTDYDTPDGTCVRDYIHVLDLVEAHILALNKITRQAGAYIYNVGTGKGHSNKEVLEVVKKVTGKDVKVINKSRRPGDANELIADASAIQKDLGFSPKHSDLETIIKTAWEWHKNLK
jgi:UDP-glucose 4-epimerase